MAASTHAKEAEVRVWSRRVDGEGAPTLAHQQGAITMLWLLGAAVAGSSGFGPFPDRLRWADVADVWAVRTGINSQLKL